jgi:hypothetical protein
MKSLDPDRIASTQPKTLLVRANSFKTNSF